MPMRTPFASACASGSRIVRPAPSTARLSCRRSSGHRPNHAEHGVSEPMATPETAEGLAAPVASDVRDLREAAGAALAARFPARWLEEQSVLPLRLADGV